MENNSTPLFFFLIIVSIWFWHDHTTLTDQVNQLADERQAENDDKWQCYEALGEANSNINEAKWSAGGSWDDMNWALGNLETVNY